MKNNIDLVLGENYKVSVRKYPVEIHHEAIGLNEHYEGGHWLGSDNSRSQRASSILLNGSSLASQSPTRLIYSNCNILLFNSRMTSESMKATTFTGMQHNKKWLLAETVTKRMERKMRDHLLCMLVEKENLLIILVLKNLRFYCCFNSHFSTRKLFS